MVLAKPELLAAIESGQIGFTPPIDAFQLQPNAIDLRIGWNFYVPESWEYTEAGRVAHQPDYLTKGSNKDYLKLIKLQAGQYFEVLPGELVLVSSLEKIDLTAGDIMAVLHPRSSMIRRGFVIQGGVVDVHYSGYLIIPIQNSTNHSLRLYPGERAYQLVFSKMTSSITPEQAAQHGVASAKYAQSTAYNLEARTDSDDELDFIRRGDVDGLKAKYLITTKQEVS